MRTASARPPSPERYGAGTEYASSFALRATADTRPTVPHPRPPSADALGDARVPRNFTAPTRRSDAARLAPGAKRGQSPFRNTAQIEGDDTAAGDYLFHLHDHLGSTQVVYDESLDTMARYFYGPYGEEMLGGNRSVTTRGFTGHVQDELMRDGAYYAPFRYYFPNLARWEKRDPLGMVDGPNLYAYVRGNPVAHFDEFGLSKKGSCRGELIAAQGACFVSLASTAVGAMSLIAGAAKCIPLCMVPTNPLCIGCIAIFVGTTAASIAISALTSGLGTPDPADWTCKMALCMLRDCRNSAKKHSSQSRAECSRESSSTCSAST